MSDGWPQVLINSEKFEKLIVVYNNFDGREGHIMQLEGGLEHLLFSRLAEGDHALHVPVIIKFALTPLNCLLLPEIYFLIKLSL